MKKQNLFALLSLLILSGNACAANGNIELESVSAKPHQLALIKMDKLASGTSYHLECRLVSDRFSGKGHSDLHVTSYGDVHVFVNGIDTSLTDGAASIRFPLNSLRATGVRKDGVIKIRNLDSYDTITVQDCVASPIGA